LDSASDDFLLIQSHTGLIKNPAPIEKQIEKPFGVREEKANQPVDSHWPGNRSNNAK